MRIPQEKESPPKPGTRMFAAMLIKNAHWNRVTASVLPVLIAATLIAGCGNQPNEPPSSGPAPGVLRTPDARFENMAGFDYAPLYIDIPYQGSALRMHYVDEGPKDAPVILALHGQGQWSYAYRDMIPIFLAAGYRVVAPDFIGFGRSDKLPNDTDYEFADHVAWLTTFIDQMDFDTEVTAFLFDWGGYFGLKIAADHPEYFDRLVLANTALPKGYNGGSEFFKKWRAGILARPEFPMAQMVNEGVKIPLSDEAMRAYDAPYPDESYKAGPRRFPLILPIEDTDAAAPANKAAWGKLASYDKPTLTLYSKMFAKSDSLGPNPLIEHIPGADGQPHAVIDASFYIVDDASVELAEKTVEFIGQ